MNHPHPIHWLRTHPRGADGLLTALVVTGALAAHAWGDSTVNDPNEVDPSWCTLLVVLLGTVPIYWRRTHTLVAGLVVVSAEVFGLFVGMGGAAFIGSVIAVYSIGATVEAGACRNASTMKYCAIAPTAPMPAIQLQWCGCTGTQPGSASTPATTPTTSSSETEIDAGQSVRVSLRARIADSA